MAAIARDEDQESGASSESLPCGWQEPAALDHLLLLLSNHYQEAKT